MEVLNHSTLDKIKPQKTHQRTGPSLQLRYTFWVEGLVTAIKWGHAAARTLQTALCKGHFPLWDNELGSCSVQLTLMTKRDVMRPGMSCACTYDGDKLWLSITACIQPGAKSAKCQWGGLAQRQGAGLVNGWTEVWIRFRSPRKLRLMGQCQATLSLADARRDAESLWQRHRPHILGNWSQLLSQLADRLNAPHPWKCYSTVWAATYSVLCPHKPTQLLKCHSCTVPLQRRPESTSPKMTRQYLSKDNLTVPLQRQPDSTSSKTTWQYLSKDNLMVPLQRQPDSTSSKTTWQYLSKDNLMVPLQRQPNGTSPKTTWQYLSKDNLMVPLQRQPNGTSPKTTWQYLFKDNLTVPLQRQPDSTSPKTT